MRVVLFGATGMIGQGVLRECLRDPAVEAVLSVGRAATGQQHPKLQELIHTDFMDFSAVEENFRGYDACFFCLGATSAGKSEPVYHLVTYEYTMEAAEPLIRLNPELTFIYVSGVGTDSTEKGRVMWARVKGRTENALIALTEKAYMFRPGYIQPLHGVRSRTTFYRVIYQVVAPLYPLLRRLFPGSVTTTERMGRAMINVATHGAPTRILEPRDINAAAAHD
jgi:uncharacterized protein YbjT (DUF2867 family)